MFDISRVPTSNRWLFDLNIPIMYVPIQTSKISFILGKYTYLFHWISAQVVFNLLMNITDYNRKNKNKY